MAPFDLVDEETARAIIGGKDTPISHATLYRGIRLGRYPKPLRVGEASNRWRTDELYAFLERASAARAVKA